MRRKIGKDKTKEERVIRENREIKGEEYDRQTDKQ